MLKANRVIAKRSFRPLFTKGDNTNNKQLKEDKLMKKSKGKGKRKITIRELFITCFAYSVLRHNLKYCLYMFLEKARRKFNL